MSIHPDSLISFGQGWLEVQDIMSKDVISISPAESIVDAARIMSENNVSCIIVLDNHNLVGILTEKDFLQKLATESKKFDHITVNSIMSSPVESIPVNMSALEASRIMHDKNIKRLPILKDQRVIGIVTQTDLTIAMSSYTIWDDVVKAMTDNVVKIEKNASIAEAIKIMITKNVSSIIVMEAEQVVGIFTVKDFLKKVVPLQKDPIYIKIEEIMTSPVISIPCDYSILHAKKLMDQKCIRRLVIMDDNAVTGIITQTDIFRAVKERIEQLEKNNKELKQSIIQTIRVFMQLISNFDNQLADHCKRVAFISILIGQKLLLSDTEMEQLETAALLHDIGMLSIPKKFKIFNPCIHSELKKIYEQHPVIGQDVFGNIQSLSEIGNIIRSHHEWYNGKGYPDGLKGEEILKLARIIRVADKYDKLKQMKTEDKPVSNETCFYYLNKYKGTRLDPMIVDNLISAIQEQLSIKNKEKKEEMYLSTN